MDRPLDTAGVRILGSLIEKESTTPDNYPLTLHAVTAACNQTSNRDPVLRLDAATVATTLQELARRQLVREVKRSDSRARRYRHLMTESLKLHEAEIAVLCVLMLRGPQTTGEIRTRTARLFAFPDLARVELTLESLMTLPEPLVARLPRQPGQKEVRYAHLLAGEPEAGSPEPDVEPEPDPVQESRVDALERELSSLRAELADLRTRFEEFRGAFQ